MRVGEAHVHEALDSCMHARKHRQPPTQADMRFEFMHACTNAQTPIDTDADRHRRRQTQTQTDTDRHSQAQTDGQTGLMNM